jgi:hypothetical protein
MINKIKDIGLAGGVIFVLGYIAQSFLPWWSIAILSFLVGIWQWQSPLKSFTYGTVAVTLLWTLYSSYQNVQNGGIISNAVSEMLGGAVSGTQLIFVTGIIGGLVGGMSAMTGSLFKQVLAK